MATLLVVVAVLTAMAPWQTARLPLSTRVLLFLCCGACWQLALVAAYRVLARIAPRLEGVRFTLWLVLLGSIPACLGMLGVLRLLLGHLVPALSLYLQTLPFGLVAAFAYRGVFGSTRPCSTSHQPPAAVEPIGVEPVGVEPVGVEPVGVEPDVVAIPSAAAAPPVGPDAFLRHHAPDLSGRRLVALQAEDHYLRLHVADGDTRLVLLRMRDAVAALGPEAGWQPHRSFWIASEARAETERRGQGWQVVLDTGLVVPVSRAALPMLRAAGLPQRLAADRAIAVGSTAE